MNLTYKTKKKDKKKSLHTQTKTFNTTEEHWRMFKKEKNQKLTKKSNIFFKSFVCQKNKVEIRLIERKKK